MSAAMNARLKAQARPGLSLAGRFLFEFVVVVAGVLVALALDAWFEGRRDAASEQTYLALLSRDLDRTIADLESFVAFESHQLDDATLAMQALAAPETADHDDVSAAMARLMSRQTLTLKSAAYEDLISTGHLALLRDASLRDGVVDFYQATARNFDVINRNNSFFVDQSYNAQVILSGLVRVRLASNHPAIAREAAAVSARVGTAGATGRDLLWDLPPGAPEWPMVQSVLLGRMLVSQTAHTVGSTSLASARELKAAVDAARRD